MALLLALALLPACACAEKRVYDLTAGDEPPPFAPDARLLEVYFAPERGADACVLRMGDDVVLVDAGTVGQRRRLFATLKEIGVDHVDVGFNTHPHDDHIGGFQRLAEVATMDRFVITFPKTHNNQMMNTLRILREQNIPIETMEDGDVLRIGRAEAQIIQRKVFWFSDNNRSAMLRVTYGECSLLLAADVEIDGQNELLKTPQLLPADILKYPHHAVTKAGWKFLAHVAPELAVVTSWHERSQYAARDARKRGIPMLFTEDGMIRLRTDGLIWVVDQKDLGV